MKKGGENWFAYRILTCDVKLGFAKLLTNKLMLLTSSRRMN